MNRERSLIPTLIPFAIMIVIGLVVILFTMPGNADAGVVKEDRPKCNKKCQQANDVFFLPGTYTDYFVSDSDGSKDGIVAVYEDVPSGIEGINCSVFKTFDDSGTSAMSVVCPGATVINGSQSQVIEDDE